MKLREYRLRSQGLKFTQFFAMTLVLLIVTCTSLGSVSAEKKSYSSWQELGQDMFTVFMEAIDAIDEVDMRGAYEKMNEAYFGYYEAQGFEKNVMSYISAKRVNHIEAQFREIKHALLGNYDHHENEIKEKILVLAGKVYRDAMVLDGVEAMDSGDEVASLIFSDEEQKQSYLSALGVELSEDETAPLSPAVEEKVVKTVDPAVRNRRSFFTSFVLMLREGMEAILVCVAIITYLVKTGNGQLRKGVYYGMLAGLIGSIFLAILVHFLLGGVGQELIEGWTMFLAVIVLFWVSNWMLSKSEEQAWEAYIQGHVVRSIDKKSLWGLITAAFLAVIREGAELILFYRAAFGSGMTDTRYAIYGLLAAVVVLLVVYVVMRYTTVRLPLKPFFLFTSILLFVMCISFMGKGVKEFSEAGVITGVTSIPAMRGFEFDFLGIYDRAETLIPQIILLIASLWILLSHSLKNRSARKKLNSTSPKAVADSASVSERKQ